MTNIQRRQEPAPLDISHLDIGPPLDDADGAPLGGALVPYELRLPAQDGDAPQSRADTHHGDSEPRKQLPSPGSVAHKSAHAGKKWHDVRRMTPREMLSYSQSLYAAGILGFDDYETLAFQPDLHPAYASTIGALTGERATPDRPRNFVRIWQERLNYARRYHAADSLEVRQADRILDALVSYPCEADALS